MPGSQFFMLLIFKGAEVELPGASQESSELRQELAAEEGVEACRRIGGVAGEIGEAGVETGLIEIIETKQLLELFNRGGFGGRGGDRGGRGGW